MRPQLALLDSPQPSPWTFDAHTPGRRRALELAQRVAASSSSVLILGPTGVGKEVLAEDIHRHGPRSGAPFVSVNCAAITPSLFESELFGHVRGAFTGAVGEKVGLVELANGGVLFLDEIGELSAEGQAKLLRFLAKGTYWPVGATRERKADVRVVAATHRELDRLAGESFREDLFYRLSVVVIRIPPLERSDVRAIARSIAEESMARSGLSLRPADIDELAERCSRRGWRGGVRELRNILERFMVLHRPELPVEESWAQMFESGEPESAADSGVRLRAPDASMAKHVDDLLFLAIARECRDVPELARRMGRTARSIYGRLRKLGLGPRDVGETAAASEAMQRMKRRVEPGAPWIRSVLLPSDATPLEAPRAGALQET